MKETDRSLRDFPSWITPSLVKELRQGMRTPAFLIMMSIFPAALSIIFLFSFIQGAHGSIIPQEASNGLFWTIISFCLMTVLPLRALSAVKEESDTRSINLLILTKLTATRIILGKWISFMTQAAMVICITLPFAAIRYYYGNINILQDIYFLFVIFAASSALTALSLWFSGMPSFCRIAVSILLVCSGITFAILGVDMSKNLSVDLQSSEFWTANAAIFFDVAIATLTFLFLAAKWFASPSENISSRIRVTLLMILLPFLLLFLPEDTRPDSLIASQSTISILVLSIGIILEATIPTPFLPVHVSQTGTQRFGWFRRFFLLPGWPGASRFCLLIALLLIIASFIISTHPNEVMMDIFSSPNNTGSSSEIPPLMALINSSAFGLTWWSSIVTLFWLMSPLQKRLGGWNPIVFFLLSYLIGFIGAIAHSLGMPILSFLPWCSMVSVLEGDSILVMTGINILVGVLALIFGGKLWRKTFRQGMIQLRAKRSATQEATRE